MAQHLLLNLWVIVTRPNQGSIGSHDLVFTDRAEADAICAAQNESKFHGRDDYMVANLDDVIHEALSEAASNAMDEG